MKGSQPGTVERRWEQWSRGINGIEGILELQSGENELERSGVLVREQTDKAEQWRDRAHDQRASG